MPTPSSSRSQRRQRHPDPAAAVGEGPISSKDSLASTSGSRASGTPRSGRVGAKKLSDASASGSEDRTSLVPSKEATDILSPRKAQDNQATFLEAEAEKQMRLKEAEKRGIQLSSLRQALDSPRSGAPSAEGDWDATPRAHSRFDRTLATIQGSPTSSLSTRPPTPRKSSASSLSSTQSRTSVLSHHSSGAVHASARTVGIVLIDTPEFKAREEEVTKLIESGKFANKSTISFKVSISRTALRSLRKCPICQQAVSSSATLAVQHYAQEHPGLEVLAVDE